MIQRRGCPSVHAVSYLKPQLFQVILRFPVGVVKRMGQLPLQNVRFFIVQYRLHFALVALRPCVDFVSLLARLHKTF
jgi:hypothetical protein